MRNHIPGKRLCTNLTPRYIGIFYPNDCRQRDIAPQQKSHSRQAGASWEVQCGHRVAAFGIEDLQYSQSFASAGAGAGGFGMKRLTCFTRRNTAKATSRKSRMLLMKTP